MTAAQWTISQTELSSVKETAVADRLQVVELKNALNKYLTKAEHNAYLHGVEGELATIKERVATIQRIQGERASKLAHDPVEQKTVDAINSAIDKRIDLIQSQITDINRQIAAALIIIDNNAVARKTSPALPP
jgi:hypothetical protein